MCIYGHVYFVSSSNPAPEIHLGKVFQISNLGPIFIRWRPRGSLRTPRNHNRGGRQGLDPWAGQGPGTRARPPFLWFREILRLPLGIQHMNMDPKLLIYKIDTAVYIMPHGGSRVSGTRALCSGGVAGERHFPWGSSPPGIVPSATLSTIRVHAVLTSQLLLCRPLNCSSGVHPTLTNFPLLCLGEFVS